MPNHTVGHNLAELDRLPPRERAETARDAVADLHYFLDEGRPIQERDAPERSRALAEALFTALRSKGVAGDAAAAALSQRIVTDELLRSECDRDQNVYLSKLFTRRMTNAVPDVVFQPETAEEIATAFRFGIAEGVPVTLRGAASTAMGGAIPADGGLVLDLSRLDSIELEDGGHVTIGAGARMRPVHAKLADAGRALPVYPSNLGGTFAGWLATGGIGLNAYGRGRALDAVFAADVVLPGGELARLRRDGRIEVTESGETKELHGKDRTQWFADRGYPAVALKDFAGTEGQFGAIAHLVLETEERPTVVPYLLAFPRLEDAVQAVSWLEETVREGLDTPGDVKLLTGAHVHHVRDVWREEDAKEWRELPGALSRDDGMPWSEVVAPSAVGATVASEPSGGVAAYLFVHFLSKHAGRTFAERLSSCPGAPVVLDAESVRFAADRFRPQQVKRLGPGFLAAEIVLPTENVAPFLPAADKLARHFGLEADTEVYFLSDGASLAIAGFLADHRKGSFRADLLLAPAFLDLAMSRFGGEPYVLGRWQANLMKRKLGRAEAARLWSMKRALDEPNILNRGAFFSMGLRGILGSGLALIMGPGVRIARLGTSLVPPVAAGVRWLLDRFDGPAAGHGKSAAEAPLPTDVHVPHETSTARAISCVNCGECNSVCPIFNESKIRLPQMLTHLGEARFAGETVGEAGSTLLDLCMRCGNCEEVCQAGIPHLPLYDALQATSDKERPKDRERHVLLLERLRASRGYMQDFLDVREGGYLTRAAAALPGSARFVLLRAEKEAGPAETCIHCGACVDVCPTSANKEYEGEDPRWITTDQDRCIGCGTCVEVCPANHQNGGRTLRVMEAPTHDWLEAAREFAALEQP